MVMAEHAGDNRVERKGGRAEETGERQGGEKRRGSVFSPPAHYWYVDRADSRATVSQLIFDR